MNEIIFDLMPGAILPRYETDGAAGFDLRAYLLNSRGEATIGPRGRILISAGFRVCVPRHYEMQIRPRSGLALKYGVTVLNSPGTIDSDYRGEVGIILHNTGSDPFLIRNGDRVAQGVIVPVIRFPMREGIFSHDTERGNGGFGSTGVE